MITTDIEVKANAWRTRYTAFLQIYHNLPVQRNLFLGILSSSRETSWLWPPGSLQNPLPPSSLWTSAQIQPAQLFPGTWVCKLLPVYGLNTPGQQFPGLGSTSGCSRGLGVEEVSTIDTISTCRSITFVPCPPIRESFNIHRLFKIFTRTSCNLSQIVFSIIQYSLQITSSSWAGISPSLAKNGLKATQPFSIHSNPI